MFDNYIFDLDGPILDGKNRHYQCYCDILKQYNFSPIDISDYWKFKRNGMKLIDILKLSRAEAIVKSFKKKWAINIEEKNYLIKDVLPIEVMGILQNLKQNNKTLYLVTMRQNFGNLMWQLKALNLIHFFAKIFTVNVSQEKASAIEKGSVSIHRTIWIGDTEADYSAARHHNIPICLLTNGLRDESYLQKLTPDYLEKDLLSWVRKYNH